MEVNIRIAVFGARCEVVALDPFESLRRIVKIRESAVRMGAPESGPMIDVLAIEPCMQHGHDSQGPVIADSRLHVVQISDSDAVVATTCKVWQQFL